ncbi:btb poz domain containing protein [Diplodia corticola]|uniref:Btb poz domain containing protein n=1 Tax=Diplodia corticola TaxID=236234 RepID=A0A1J9SER2_9PEZI|nr:btb poz domain containing protein [Diplodia corticola]OJD38061.1 btb poz domain containing protein [Diplodia corticola]
MTQPYNLEGKQNANVKRATLITGQTISVIVGGGDDDDNDEESPCLFLVHRKLICAFSPFFNAACRGPWKEHREGIVTLPEEDPATFELYVKWLYTGELVDCSSPTTEDEDADNTADPQGQERKRTVEGDPFANDQFNTVYTILACAYFLGDVLLDHTFKNAVIDALIRRVKQTNRYPCAMAALVYENTSSWASPLRRLLVDFYAYAHKRDWFLGSNRAMDMDNGPREFLRDVLVKLVSVQEEGCKECLHPWDSDFCQYHVHPDGVRCPKTFQVRR